MARAAENILGYRFSDFVARRLLERPPSVGYCSRFGMLVFLRFDIEDFVLKTSGRSVGFISTCSGTYTSPWCRVMSKKQKRSRLLNFERKTISGVILVVLVVVLVVLEVVFLILIAVVACHHFYYY